MFSKILIANRGEIALRIIRACRDLGVETVAVYSEVDEDAIYLRYADEAICIGPGPSSRSYLDIQRIISAAEITNVDAIHPGYGFLSENPTFADICRECRVTFIGPSPEAIEALGNKARAKELARSLGVPVTPGSDGLITVDDDARAVAARIGYPVIVKAAAGGGGRGMRVAHSELALMSGLLSARTEAEAAFKDGSVFIEKFIERPRHIEIQVIADGHGNVVFLGERDCSIQRRHQKLLEEAPSPVMTEDLRHRMGEAAVRLVRAAGYVNAGTVEFLVDRDRNFYFMEVNSRIQVEHPVTEAVTGVDLVKEQIRVAAGLPLSFRQEDVAITGHAIECRVNAEDPDDGFRPSPGRIGTYAAPGGPGIRLDSHCYGGYNIPSQYDSMIAKVIARGRDRMEAIRIMRRALSEYVIEGISTTIPLHLRILGDAEFMSGNVDTGFVESRLLSSGPNRGE